jgi:hypothetical protein
MPYRNISLVFECDAATLKGAAELARDYGGRLTLIDVVKGIPDHVIRLGSTTGRPRSERLLRESQRVASARRPSSPWETRSPRSSGTSMSTGGTS